MFSSYYFECYKTVRSETFRGSEKLSYNTRDSVPIIMWSRNIGCNLICYNNNKYLISDCTPQNCSVNYRSQGLTSKGWVSCAGSRTHFARANIQGFTWELIVPAKPYPFSLAAAWVFFTVVGFCIGSWFLLVLASIAHHMRAERGEVWVYASGPRYTIQFCSVRWVAKLLALQAAMPAIWVQALQHMQFSKCCKFSQKLLFNV
jgi:hypothetical protein